VKGEQMFLEMNDVDGKVKHLRLEMLILGTL
jgi:hypothetical protein